MSNFIYSIESLYNTIDCKYKASAYFIDLTHIVKNYIGVDWHQYINFNNNTYNNLRVFSPGIQPADFS